MIEVTKLEKSTGRETRVAIPEGKCPFAVLDAVMRGMGLVVQRFDPEHDAVMEARRARIEEQADAGPREDTRSNRAPAERKAVGVRDTSVDAYRKAKRSGKLTAQQRVIVDWFRSRIGDATRQEISKGTGLPINAVCGRVNELLDPEVGALRETRKRRCRVTGETVNALVAQSGS